METGLPVSMWDSERVPRMRDAVVAGRRQIVSHHQGENAMASKFEIYKDKAGEFRFRLKAGNGQNILGSEGYKAKTGCLSGIESVKKNAPEDARYERKTTAGGKFAFNLRAGNNQVIGTSQSYDSESNRDNGIESVKKSAPTAAVEDLST